MDERARIVVVPGGPLLVEDASLVRLVRGEQVPDGPPHWSATALETPRSSYSLCRCDGSATKPFCDRWPDRLPCFAEPEMVGAPTPSFTWRPPDGLDGPVLALKPDGPIRVSGGVRIERADGSVIDDGERTSLCRCGHSGSMPFCDSTHKIVGYRDDRGAHLDLRTASADPDE
jgi:CDGSH-type Zn-finger protein